MAAVALVGVAVAVVVAVAMESPALFRFLTFLAGQAGAVKGATVRQRLAVVVRLLMVIQARLVRRAGLSTQQAAHQQTKVSPLTVTVVRLAQMALQELQARLVRRATLSTA